MQVLRRLSERFAPVTTRNRRGGIGLELSQSALHLVQLGKRPDQSLFLHARASVPFPIATLTESGGRRALREALRTAREQGPFKGRHAVVAMPAGQFRTMSVNYRLPSDQLEDQTIAQIMNERLDGPLSDYVIDYIPVRANARDAEKLAIVAVSRRDDVMRLLGALHDAGLFVDALEIAPVALRRLANTVNSDVTDMTMILNTGQRRTYLTLLSGRRLLLDQAIEIGEIHLVETLADALDLEPTQARDLLLRTGLHPGATNHWDGHHEGETGIFNTLLEILRPKFLELVDQTDQAFMYAAAQTRGGGDARILFLGAMARWPGCDEVISGMTQLPVIKLPDAGAPFPDVGGDAPQTGNARAEYAVASGLALRGLIDGQ